MSKFTLFGMVKGAWVALNDVYKLIKAFERGGQVASGSKKADKNVVKFKLNSNCNGSLHI